MQKTHLSKVPFQKQLVGTIALMVIGFNFTKRYMTFPHHHKDTSQPMLLLNGELHPFENQPPVIIQLSNYRVQQINIDLIPYIKFEDERWTGILNCTTGCCSDMQCLDYNSCSLLAQIKTFETYNYCSIDSQCPANSCCFDQKCVPSSTCLVHIYIPLFMSVLFAFGGAFGSSYVINHFLKIQEARIKKEILKKKRLANKKKNKEKERLLDKERQEEIERMRREAQQAAKEEEDKDHLDDFLAGKKIKMNQSKQSKDQNQVQKGTEELMTLEQITQAMQQFQINPLILQGLLNGKISPTTLDPRMVQYYSNYIGLMQKYKALTQGAQLQMQVQQTSNGVMNVQLPAPQRLPPIHIQKDIANSVQQNLLPPSKPNSQQKSRPTSPVTRQQVQVVGQMNFQAPDVLSQNQGSATPKTNNGSEGPKFFGKPNPNNIGNNQNPVYGNLKPQAPIAGMKAEAQEKRSILSGIQGPLRSHIDKRKNALIEDERKKKK